MIGSVYVKVGLFGIESCSRNGGATPVSLLERDYEYNSLGAISSIQRNMHSSLVQGGETQHTFSFTYDAFNRLLFGIFRTMNT